MDHAWLSDPSGAAVHKGSDPARFSGGRGPAGQAAVPVTSPAESTLLWRPRQPNHRSWRWWAWEQKPFRGCWVCPVGPGHACRCGLSLVTCKAGAASRSEGHPRGCCRPTASPPVCSPVGPTPLLRDGLQVWTCCVGTRGRRRHLLRSAEWCWRAGGRRKCSLLRDGTGLALGPRVQPLLECRRGNGEESGHHLFHPAGASSKAMASAQMPVHCLFHKPPPKVCCHQSLSLLLWVAVQPGA